MELPSGIEVSARWQKWKIAVMFTSECTITESLALMRQLSAAVAVLIWGIASFALMPPLQMRVMEAAKDAPNLA